MAKSPAKKKAPANKTATKKKKPTVKKKAPKDFAEAEPLEVQKFKADNRPGYIEPPGKIKKEATRNKQSEALTPFANHSRMIAMNLLTETGKASPIEVMFRNMWWAHEEAEQTLEVLMSKMDAVDFDQGMDLFREVLRMRGISQACARDAAPYVHAKISMLNPEDFDGKEEQIEFVTRKVIDPKKRAA